MTDTYLKYIELAVDDFESKIVKEINCSNDEFGRVQIEKMRKVAGLNGRLSLIVRVPVSYMPVLF